jgi:hypothetical protein
MHRLQCLVVFALIGAGIGGATSAQANMVVGNAVLIQQDVEGAFNDQDWTQTSKGDDVFEAEFIRTQVNSRANFALLDGSTIGLGATAIMKIDHVVLDPHNHSIQKLIVSAKDGAVRWISGNSMSGAYQIDTPHAVITDEGTAFDLVVEPQRTLVLLHTGRVTVCAIHAPGRCKPLSRRGEMVLASTDDVVGPWESGLEPSGFETQCLNAKCAIAAFVAPPQPPSDGDRKGRERPPEPHHAVVPSGPQIREVVLPVPTDPPPPHPPVVTLPSPNPPVVTLPPPNPPVVTLPPPNPPVVTLPPPHPPVVTLPPPYPPVVTLPPPNPPVVASPPPHSPPPPPVVASPPPHSPPPPPVVASPPPHSPPPPPVVASPARHPLVVTSPDGPAISTTTTGTKNQGLPIGTTTTSTRAQNPTTVTTHSTSPNVMLRSGPPTLTMRSGPPNLPPNLMMRSGPPNLMMRSGPPQLHLPGGPFRGFGRPR